jgi:2-oxoglutarate dehydrogenase E1 component
MRRPYRKPLVVVAPKKLLKFGGAGSSIEEFAKGTTFKRIIDDESKDLVAADKVRKVVYCTG